MTARRQLRFPVRTPRCPDQVLGRVPELSPGEPVAHDGACRPVPFVAEPAG